MANQTATWTWSHTAVGWDMFCREVCEVALFERREKIGGPGNLVQIDESKIGKRKYHRGHVVVLFGRILSGGTFIGGKICGRFF